MLNEPCSLGGYALHMVNLAPSYGCTSFDLLSCTKMVMEQIGHEQK